MYKLNFKLWKISLLLTGLSLLQSCAKETTDSTDLYGNWSRQSDFEGVARTEAVSFTINNKAYVGTGFKQAGQALLTDFWEFDQSTGTWVQKADLPAAGRSSAVAFSLNNKGYVGTGYDGANKLKDFWEYDPATNRWTRKADFAGTARYGAVAFSVGGKGYVGTGFDDNHLKDLWQYDAALDQWTQKASLGGTKRTDAIAFVVNDRAFICSGLNNGSYVDDIWEYNATANQWTQKRRMANISDESYDDDYNMLRSNATVFVMNNKAYMTGGEQNGVLATTWEYDPATDLWAQKTAFEGTARVGAVGFTLNNRGYIATGNNGTYRFDDLWEFNPLIEKIDND